MESVYERLRLMQARLDHCEETIRYYAAGLQDGGTTARVALDYKPITYHEQWVRENFHNTFFDGLVYDLLSEVSRLRNKLSALEDQEKTPQENYELNKG